jgi:hypothetical protein
MRALDISLLVAIALTTSVLTFEEIDKSQSNNSQATEIYVTEIP